MLEKQTICSIYKHDLIKLNNLHNCIRHYNYVEIPKAKRYAKTPRVLNIIFNRTEY